MSDVTKAEAHRRAREWLRIDFEDSQQTAAFEASKRVLSPQSFDDIPALIAIGEYGWVRALLPRLAEANAFLRGFGAYFIASADDGFARMSWPRVVAMLENNAVDAATLRNLAIAAEAIGEQVIARELNDRARAMPSTMQEPGGPIVETVYGLLGYAPDAPKGRLLLRPRIDPVWARLQVQNIRIGDALIELLYSRNDERMEFAFSQVAGAYPVRLIFEPILATRVQRTFVDGMPATLDFRPHEDGIIIPVQIMLDERRIVRFE